MPFNVSTSSGGAVTNYPPSGPFVFDLTTAIDAASITANTTIGSSSCTGSVQVSLDNFSTCLSLKTPTLSNGDTRLTITPLPFMKPLTVYKVRLTTALKSYQGVNLGSDYVSGTYTTRDFGKWGFAVQFTSPQLFYFSINQTTGNIGTVLNVSNGSISLPLAIDPSGKFLVSSNNSGGTFNYSSINQSTGVPSTGLTYSHAFNRGFVYHQTLSTIYGAGDNQINRYTFNTSTGVPTSNANVPLPGTTLTGIGIHPNGRFVYASGSANQSINAAEIDLTTGNLVGIVAQITAGGANPQLPVIEPGGNFVYSTNTGPQTMSYYSLNANTGAPTLIGSVAVGTAPQAAAVDPTGRFVYVGNNTGASISVFNINTSTGVPTLRQTATNGAGEPTYIAIEASGRFLFLSNGLSTNTIASYSIDQQTGALTLINSQTAANAQGIAVY